MSCQGACSKVYLAVPYICDADLGKVRKLEIGDFKKSFNDDKLDNNIIIRLGNI